MEPKKKLKAEQVTVFCPDQNYFFQMGMPYGKSKKLVKDIITIHNPDLKVVHITLDDEKVMVFADLPFCVEGELIDDNGIVHIENPIIQRR